MNRFADRPVMQQVRSDLIADLRSNLVGTPKQRRSLTALIVLGALLLSVGTYCMGYLDGGDRREELATQLSAQQVELERTVVEREQLQGMLREAGIDCEFPGWPAPLTSSGRVTMTCETVPPANVDHPLETEEQ